MGSEDQEKSSASGRPRDLDDLLALYRENDARRDGRVERFLELQKAGRALYSDGQGNPVLRKSFAVFIDELGTSRRMENYSNKDLTDDLMLYDEARLSLLSPDNRSDEYVRALYFTDNIMLAVPAWPGSDHPDKGLGFALGVVAEYQARLAIMGRFSRGGITYGELYADHSFGTGPALVEAVNLEKKSRSPRVLLDARCRRLGLAEVRELGYDELNPLDAERLILRDGKEAFVNYLAAVTDPSSRQTNMALEAHALAIRENLDRWAQDENIRPKYEWLADYHDYFVTQISWFPEYVIGSLQSQSFAPLTSRLFGLGELVGKSLATTFHQASTKEDVNAIIRAGRPALADLHAEFPDPDSFFDMPRQAGMAIHSLCMLRDRLGDGRIPGKYAADVCKLARHSESVIRAVGIESLELSGMGRERAAAGLIALADALRVVWLSPRHWKVGRLKASELGRLVGAMERDQDANP